MKPTTRSVSCSLFVKLAALLSIIVVIPLHAPALVRGNTISPRDENIGAADVELTVAMVLSAADTLACTMKNNGKKPISVDSPEIHPCKFVFIKPNGAKREFTSHIGEHGAGPSPLIHPGETKTWCVNISEYFGRRVTQMAEKGTYRFTWVYTQWKSEEESFENKSNELLIFKKEDAPKVNPETGAPE